MTADDLARLLDRLAPDLDGLAEPWGFIGSAALIVAGVDWPDCADLDIVTTAAGAETLATVWRGWQVRDYAPEPDGPFRSRFARYDISPGAVEVMGDFEVRTPDGWRPLAMGAIVRHRFGNRTWPAPSLADQLRILRLFGRPKDLAKAAFLESRGCAT